jgi:hypothetical protein
MRICTLRCRRTIGARGCGLTYVANECSDDIMKVCKGVRVGEGKVLECLEKNEKDVSDRCNQAIKDDVRK